MINNLPSPDDVASYLEDIQHDGWSLEDYDASYGESEPLTLTVELEWSKPTFETQREAIAILEKIEGDFEDGIPVDAVIETFIDELQLSVTEAQAILNQLKKTGEVYKPDSDTVRRT